MAALLSDPLERCRLTALQLLLEAVPRIADAAFLLPGLAPHLVARMGCTPLQVGCHHFIYKLTMAKCHWCMQLIHFFVNI
jgi:hypothetical protein